jgi:hypothetical protein
MTIATSTLLLVSVPARGASAPLLDRGVVRFGLLLLAWSERHRGAEHHSVDLGRVDRPAVSARPFC